MSQFSNSTIAESAVNVHGRTGILIVESCIFILLCLAALVGNLLVCLAFYRNHSLRTVTNYFVVSLALTDLSMAVLQIPLTVSASIANKWIAGEIGCKLSYSCGIALAGSSMITVMFVAVNRYLHVTRPTLYQRVYSKKFTIIIAISAWIIPAAVATSRFLTSMKRFRIFLVQPVQCFQHFSHKGEFITLTVIYNVFIAVPSLIIVFCYVKIWQTIRQHITGTTVSSQRRLSVYGGVQESKVTRMLTFVVVGFYLCWLPLFISNILKLFDATAKSVIQFWHFCYLFPLYTSSAINPVIYATMSRPFRKEFLKILRGVYQCFS